MSTYFNRTCEVFDRKSCTEEALNDVFTDPCSCLYYYRCGLDYEMLHLPCSPGTAFNYETKTCDRIVEVFNTQDCDEETNAWKRCNVSDTRRRQLEDICLGSEITGRTTTINPTVKDSASSTSINSASSSGINSATINPTVTDSASSTSISSSSSAGINSVHSTSISPGIVIGAVIASSLFTAIIFLAIVMYRRRQKSRLSTSQRNPSNNTEYNEAENPVEPYSVIHDGLKDDHTYTEIPNSNGPTTSNAVATHHQDGELNDNCWTREVTTYQRPDSGYEIPRTAVSASNTRISDLYLTPQ